MIILNMGDGTSQKFDLSVPQDLASLNALGRNAAAMAGVRGVWLKTNEHSNTVPTPRGFTATTLEAELLLDGDKPVGERVAFQVDDMLLAVWSYYGVESGRTSKVTLHKTGKPRWRP